MTARYDLHLTWPDMPDAKLYRVTALNKTNPGRRYDSREYEKSGVLIPVETTDEIDFLVQVVRFDDTVYQIKHSVENWTEKKIEDKRRYAEMLDRIKRRENRMTVRIGRLIVRPFRWVSFDWLTLAWSLEKSARARSHKKV